MSDQNTNIDKLQNNNKDDDDYSIISGIKSLLGQNDTQLIERKSFFEEIADKRKAKKQEIIDQFLETIDFHAVIIDNMAKYLAKKANEGQMSVRIHPDTNLAPADQANLIVIPLKDFPREKLSDTVSTRTTFVVPTYGKNLIDFYDVADKLPGPREIQRKFYEDFGTWITNFEYYESLSSGLSCTFIAIWDTGHPAVHYWKNEMTYEEALEALEPKRALGGR